MTPHPAVKKALLALGNQSEAARKLGISRTYVGLILKGERSASSAILKKLGLARVETIVKANAA